MLHLDNPTHTSLRGCSNRMKGDTVSRWQKTATLGAVFGGLSTAPQHVGLAALNSLKALAPSFDGFEPLPAHPYILPRPFPSPFSQATYFGFSTSDPKMDFSRPLASLGSRHMWDSVPICLSSSLPYSSSLSELGCLLSLQPNPGIQSLGPFAKHSGCVVPETGLIATLNKAI
jgi:hypothetical protein